jgi:S1-C subfamily serine protease
VGNPLAQDFYSITVGNVRDNKYTNSLTGGSVEALYSDIRILPGNSGGPVMDLSGLVMGLSNYTSTFLFNDRNTISFGFVGGCNATIAAPITNAIITTGTSYQTKKGYLGLTSSVVTAGAGLLNLKAKYSNFSIGTPDGIIVTGISNDHIAVTGSRLQNASPRVMVDDIIIDITYKDKTTAIGVMGNQCSITRVTYLATPGDLCTLKIVRPGTNSTFYSIVRLDKFPNAYDVVFTNNSSYHYS